MIRTPLRVFASVFAFALVGVPGVASAANECEVDADCGHGFDCFSTVGSVGADQGGSGGGSPTGSGGTAGTGTAGTASAGAPSGIPVTAFLCGNGMCEGTETPRGCPSDCESINICVLAECTSVSDCAEGYSCPISTRPGTGGGPNAPFCGDGLCNGTENAQTCPADCEVVRYCTPESGYCMNDAQCASGFYCNFMGTSGVGTGGAASGGSSGTGGSANASGGAPAVGGSASMPEFAPPAGSSGTASSGAGGEAGEAADPIPSSGGTSGIVAAQGTCMPREMSGTGGATGSVGGGPAMGGSGSAYPGTAGVGTGGTTADFPPEQGGAGSSSTGAGGTTLPGSGAQGSGGSGTNSTGGSGGQPATDEDDGDERIVTHGGGCSVAARAASSEFGFFAVLALGGVLARRRSRR